MNQKTQETPWEGIVEHGPVRADKWVQGQLPEYSMVRVRELFGQGRVRAYGRALKKGERLVEGDIVTVDAAPSLAAHAAGFELLVVHEDPDLIVVEKPAGVPTQPLSPDETDTLVNAVLHRFPDLAGVGDKPLEPGLLHRLDAKTQGLVMFARHDEAFDFMKKEIRLRRVRKRYLALVRGEVPRDSGEIELPLGRHPSESGLMVPAEGDAVFRGKPLRALTRYQVKDRGRGVSLVELELITGVMHQLRVHLAALGHPILGDDRYGPQPDPGSAAYALHAHRLDLTLPGSLHRLSLRSPRPLSLADADRWK